MSLQGTWWIYRDDGEDFGDYAFEGGGTGDGPDWSLFDARDFDGVTLHAERFVPSGEPEVFKREWRKRTFFAPKGAE